APVHRGGVAQRVVAGHGEVAPADPPRSRDTHRGHLRDAPPRHLTRRGLLQVSCHTPSVGWWACDTKEFRLPAGTATMPCVPTGAPGSSPAPPAAWSSGSVSGVVPSTRPRPWPPCSAPTTSSVLSPPSAPRPARFSPTG